MGVKLAKTLLMPSGENAECVTSVMMSQWSKYSGYWSVERYPTITVHHLCHSTDLPAPVRVRTEASADNTSIRVLWLWSRQGLRPFNSPAFRGCHPDFVKITRSPG